MLECLDKLKEALAQRFTVAAMTDGVALYASVRASAA
jgi:hypothetical protein